LDGDRYDYSPIDIAAIRSIWVIFLEEGEVVDGN